MSTRRRLKRAVTWCRNLVADVCVLVVAGTFCFVLWLVCALEGEDVNSLCTEDDQ